MLTNRLQYLFVALMMAAPVCCFAQLNLSTESPIWGTLGSGNRTASPLHDDPNWGVLPSQQTLNVTSNENSFLRRKKEPNRRVNRNVRGEPILLDLQGNIVYDVYGNTVVDSIALGSQDGSFGSMGLCKQHCPSPSTR